MRIRPITPDDAAPFLHLCTQLDYESKFMLYEAGERTTTGERQRQMIEGLLAHDNQTILVLEQDGRLAGYIGAFGETLQRNRHSAYIVIGILKEFTGQGWGRRLFEEMETWARQHGLHRLELTVMIHNTAGLNLYQKMGFQIEGTRKHSLRIDGKYVDEYTMAKILEN